MKPKGQLQKENDTKFLQMLKDQRRDGKTTEHGLYEMLQEYMIENEMLRFVIYLYAGPPHLTVLSYTHSPSPSESHIYCHRSDYA